MALGVVAAELRELDDAELIARLKESKEELFNLRFQLATGQLQNIMVIKGVKRDIARCMTALRQLEQKDAQ